MSHVEDHGTGGTRILGVQVPAYKNLRDVWLPWSDGLVLLGANGAGKTNLLEAVALVLGNDETLRRGRHRFDFTTSGLAVVVEADHEHMPLPPHPDHRIKYPEVWPGGLAWQVRADDEWWQEVNPDSYVDSTDWRAAAVLYRLESVAPPVTDEGAYERRFVRSLLKAGSGWGGPPDSHDVVLELPDALSPPAELSWLPRLRTTDEADEDLRRAFEDAQEDVEVLVVRFNDALGGVLPDEQGSEAGWLLHEVAALAANEELAVTASSLTVESIGEGDAHWSVGIAGESGRFEIGQTGSNHLLERLSSGQQRWADEAFATMSSAMRRYGRRARVFAEAADRLSAEDWERSRVSLTTTIEAVRADQYWSYGNFTTVLHELEPMLLGATTSRDHESERVERIFRAFFPHHNVVRPRCSVRVFDEPEAHLHPGEQRRIARAIDKLRLRGNNVLLASHSPAFLDIAGWNPIRVKAGRVEEVEALGAPARTAVARDLGATRGDLLAGISALLIVEGAHDQLVLETCFGADLRTSGVVVLPMRGTENLPSVLALDFIQRYMDVPPTIMVDFSVAARIKNGTGKSQEERKLVELGKQAEQRGFEFTILPLTRPDIVCYLDDNAVAALHPGFAGWDEVHRAFVRLRPRPKFKEWLLEEYAVDLRSTAHIQQVLEVMTTEQLLPGGELVRGITGLLARIDE